MYFTAESGSVSTRLKRVVPLLCMGSTEYLLLVQEIAATRSRGSGGYWSALLSSLTGVRSAFAFGNSQDHVTPGTHRNKIGIEINALTIEV
jgi:hypothetical protein